MSLPLCPKHKVPLLPEGAHLLYCPDELCCYATTRAALGAAGKQAKGKSSNLGAFPSGPKKKSEEEIP